MGLAYFFVRHGLPKKFRMNDATLNKLIKDIGHIVQNLSKSKDDLPTILNKSKNIFDHFLSIKNRNVNFEKSFKSYIEDSMESNYETVIDPLFMSIFKLLESAGEVEESIMLDMQHMVYHYVFHYRDKTYKICVAKNVGDGSMAATEFLNGFAVEKGTNYYELSNILFERYDNQIAISLKQDLISVTALERIDPPENYKFPEAIYKEMMFDIDAAKRLSLQRSFVLVGLPGTGKCLEKGTPILMFDGSIKPVEDIVVGDQIMGPDSKPRNILSLARGQEEMFDVIPVKGDKWGCNRSHILSLAHSGTDKIINISVDDYLKLGAPVRYKQYRTECINFDSKPTELDPYFIGLWLGDGTVGSPSITNQETEVIDYLKGYADSIGYRTTIRPNNNSPSCFKIRISRKSEPGRHKKSMVLQGVRNCYINGEKRISKEYLINSEKVRLEVLAGLIDTDGYLDNNGYQITTMYDGLKDDILFIARSLGLAAYASKVTKTIKSIDFTGEYWSVYISGHTNKIPCRVIRKQAALRRQVKNVLHTGIRLESKGIGDYYGFEIDGDHLFVLGDFTVTHNTTYCFELSKRISGKVLKLDSSILRSVEYVSATELKYLLEALECDFILVDDIDRIQFGEISTLLFLLEVIKTLRNKATLLCTANNLGKIDTAVLRPGRIDDI